MKSGKILALILFGLFFAMIGVMSVSAYTYNPYYYTYYNKPYYYNNYYKPYYYTWTYHYMQPGYYGAWYNFGWNIPSYYYYKYYPVQQYNYYNPYQRWRGWW